MAVISFLLGLYASSKHSIVPYGTAEWWTYVIASCGLVIFAGLMSGLTLGLMSIDLLDLEILKRSTDNLEKHRAEVILPVVTKQHQLLVTLLLCNAAAMEALPLFLDRLTHPVVAVLLSVTLVLIFGEILPQAACSRYGLAVGAKLIWLVKFLMAVCWPIAYPVGKGLDLMLGHNESGVFRRAQLKELVKLHAEMESHAEEEGDGPTLAADEAKIINGVFELIEKTAEQHMTPIEKTFSLDVNTKLDWEVMGQILARGHSRVPIYFGSRENIIGIVLVKNLLRIDPKDETPISSLTIIRRIPRIAAETRLYDLLNEFQLGGSHMAAVVRQPPEAMVEGEIHEEHVSTQVETNKIKSANWTEQGGRGNVGGSVSLDSTVVVEVEDKVAEGGWRWGAIASNSSASEGASKRSEGGGLGKNKKHSLKGLDPGDGFEAEAPGEVIGIITLEDVIEELIGEPILDETDEYEDVATGKRRTVSRMSKISSFRLQDGTVVDMKETTQRTTRSDVHMKQVAGKQTGKTPLVSKPSLGQDPNDLHTPLLGEGA